MNLRTQLKVEVRSVFWAWCVIGLFALTVWLPWMQATDTLDVVRLLVFMLGVPLLATLPFGREFQYGTFPMLLSQSLSRSVVWRMKTVVSIASVSSVLGVYVWVWRSQPWLNLFLAGAWAIVCTSSAALCTLQARSLIGGWSAALLAGVVIIAPVAAIYLYDSGWLEPHTAWVVGGVSVFGGSAIMLWIGRLALIRFQSLGSAPALSLPGMNSQSLWRLPVWGLPRCRRSGAIRNLIRKEVCLLWPLWQMTLVMSALLVLLTPLRFVHFSSFDSRSGLWALFGIVIVVLGGGLGAILAGCLSIGGERESGTMAWQASLPVSLRVQWTIKLLTGLLCPLASMTLVIAIARLLLGPAVFTALSGDDPGVTPFFLVTGFVTILLITTLTAFWCASASKGPIEAVLAMLPLVVAILSAFSGGKLLASKFMESGILDSLVSRVHPYPFDFDTILYYIGADESRVGLWAGVIPIALFQSYRLFRRPLAAGLRTTVRYTVVLTAFALIGGLVQQVPTAFIRNVQHQTSKILSSTASAVRSIRFDQERLKEQPLQISADELERTGQMPRQFRSWLSGTGISVAPANHFTQGMPGKPKYIVTVNLSNGWTCAIPELYGLRSYLASCKPPTGHWDSWLFP